MTSYPSVNSDETPALHAQLLQDLTGYQRAAVMQALVHFNVVSIISDGCNTASQLAAQLKVNASALKRLLNAAVSLQLLSKNAEEQYAVTPRGDLLRSDHPLSLAPYARLSLAQFWLPWRELTLAVQTGDTVFEHVHGTTNWGYRKANPEQGTLFDTWQKSESRRSMSEIMGSLNLSGHQVIADIGGGIGTLLEACLRRWPQTEGILFEQVQTVEKMSVPSDLTGRLTLVGGDFFQKIPVQADVFLLKSVLHNWDDDRGRQILARCAEAMHDSSRLWVIERVLRNDHALSTNAHMIDLHMLMVTSGRERTLEEYTALAQQAGLRFVGLTRTTGDYGLIELRRESPAA